MKYRKKILKFQNRQSKSPRNLQEHRTLKISYRQNFFLWSMPRDCCSNVFRGNYDIYIAFWLPWNDLISELDKFSAWAPRWFFSLQSGWPSFFERKGELRKKEALNKKEKKERKHVCLLFFVIVLYFSFLILAYSCFYFCNWFQLHVYITATVSLRVTPRISITRNSLFMYYLYFSFWNTVLVSLLHDIHS